MHPDFSALAERLTALPPAARRFRPDAPLLCGLETRRQADRYYWDGMNRGESPSRPFIVFQVTLSGEGMYEWHGCAERVPSGRAFTALVPSAHRYYLPPETSPWSFFWIILKHSYTVARMAERLRSGAPPVFDLPSDGVLLNHAIRLYEGAFPDRYAEELAILAFLMDYERFADQIEGDHPAGLGERLREETRRFVNERLNRPADVSELANAYGMSRTRFSHYFREATGDAPAHFMARIRLEEVARLLMQTDASLTSLAESTGFADSNHLCKAFRRVYGITPGAYRRQVR